jgi:hypothetical protein
MIMDESCLISSILSRSGQKIKEIREMIELEEQMEEV